MATTSMRDVEGTINWYKINKDAPPFDPDGMCLKVCRTARDIDPMFPSALAAQIATPKEFRVYDPADIRRGMVAYFDDPNDSNPFGHIVTVHGRDEEKHILEWTNSVVPNKLTVVFHSYFPRNWGDTFQFAATWLNGVELEFGEKTTASTAPTARERRLRNLEHAVDDLMAAVAHAKKKGRTRLVEALQRDISRLRKHMKEFA